jgi:hypothetical protein
MHRVSIDGGVTHQSSRRDMELGLDGAEGDATKQARALAVAAGVPPSVLEVHGRQRPYDGLDAEPLAFRDGA